MFYDRFFVESYSQIPNSFEVEEGAKKKFEEEKKTKTEIFLKFRDNITTSVLCTIDTSFF